MYVWASRRELGAIASEHARDAASRLMRTIWCSYAGVGRAGYHRGRDTRPHTHHHTNTRRSGKEKPAITATAQVAGDLTIPIVHAKCYGELNDVTSLLIPVEIQGQKCG